MKNHAVLEGLLRPPIELYSAGVAGGVAVVAAAAPWALMMPLTPSAPRGTSGRTWVGQLAAMSALTGLGRASGAGGAMTGGSAGGVAVDAAMTGALTGGAMSGGGT